MNCVLFAKMDQVFSKENKSLKKILENWKKNTGKVREFYQSGKVGTLVMLFSQLHIKSEQTMTGRLKSIEGY